MGARNLPEEKILNTKQLWPALLQRALNAVAPVNPGLSRLPQFPEACLKMAQLLLALLPLQCLETGARAAVRPGRGQGEPP